MGHSSAIRNRGFPEPWVGHVGAANSGREGRRRRRRLGNTAAPPRLRSLIIPAAGEGAVDPLTVLASQVTIEQLYFSGRCARVRRCAYTRVPLGVYTKVVRGARRRLAATGGRADDERLWPRSQPRLIRLNSDFQ